MLTVSPEASSFSLLSAIQLSLNTSEAARGSPRAGVEGELPAQVPCGTLYTTCHFVIHGYTAGVTLPEF